MPTRVAVVAGCNYTPDPAAPVSGDAPALPALQFAEADAQAMADLLQAQGFAVTLLLGSAATRAGIVAALETQSHLAEEPDDLLLFYFAGHGGPDPANATRAYLIPADATPADLPNTALDLTHLARYQAPAGRTLTLLDCCYSGAIVGIHAPPTRAAAADGAHRGQALPAVPLPQEFGVRAQATFAMQPGHVVITACAANEQARELRQFGHGVFTYYILEHWRNNPGEVSYGSLVHYVDTMLEKAGLPRLVHGGATRDRFVLRAGSATGRAVLHIPYPRNPRFVGRDDVLLQLDTLLHTQDVVALTGAGGLGKTQLASELAHRNREQFPGGVFWLTMDPPDGIATQVAAYAGPTGLNLPAADALAFDEKLAAVREIWDHAPLSLLIFDNLDAPAVLDQWRPQGPGARVLITSRRQTWPAHSGVDMLALDVLPRPASQTLLLTPRALQQSATVDTLLASDGPVAHKVCDELGDFPLALALAAAYLEAYPSVTLANYLAEVRSQVLAHDSLDATLDAPLPTKHAPSIVATFALSYNQLKPGTALDALARKLLRRQLKPGTALDALALKLLHRAAHAAATPIPAPLLVRLADRDVADPHAAGEVSRAVNRLAALGLVERLPDGSARLHRLLAAYARHRTPTPATDASALEITLINTAYQLWEAGYPQAAQPYLPHLGAVATTAAPRSDPQAATLLNTLAGLLQDMGDYAAARPLVERALAIREQTLGPAHPATASSLNNLAELLRAQGDYAAARPLYDRAFDISDQTLGPTHRQTASTLNNLASLLHAQGAFPAAHFLYARALADHEQTLGPAHPATAGSLSNLARLLRDEGDYAAARPLADRALAIDEATYGPTHPAVAADLNNLAGLLQAQGDYTAARPLYDRALAIDEATYGPTHPAVATDLNTLASLLADQGDYAAAHPLYARALAIAEQTFGPAHPQTATRLNSLAELLRTQGDYAAARPLYDRALAIDEAAYGPTHPAVATDLNYLASLLADQGDYAAARPLLQRALAIAEQTLGTHPNTQAIRRNLLSLLLRITRVTLAAPLPPATLARLADLLAQRQA